MVLVDYDLTKEIILCPCTDKLDALETAKLFHSFVYKRFGLPDVFLLDRGLQFDSKVLKELWKITGVD